MKLDTKIVVTAIKAFPITSKDVAAQQIMHRAKLVGAILYLRSRGLYKIEQKGTLAYEYDHTHRLVARMTFN